MNVCVHFVVIELIKLCLIFKRVSELSFVYIFRDNGKSDGVFSLLVSHIGTVAFFGCYQIV